MTYILLLLIPLSCFADVFDLNEEELNPDAQEILIKKPEKYLRDESMIYDLNSDLGIKDQRRYTGTDNNRFSVAGHINGSYEHPTDILGFEAAYMHRSSRYSRMWYGAQIFQKKAYFDAITRNARGSGGANSESSFQRPGSTRDTVTAIGLGAGYRFKLLLDFFPTEDVFETIDVFFNGVQLTESFIGKTYQGYGLTTNYSLHKRSSTAFFYGGKMGYNLARVTREKIGTERKEARTLTLGWLSFAFELGFFF